MSTTSPVDADLEVEQQRQDAINELVAEHGPDWAQNYAPGTFGCHELLDRTNLMAKMVEESVLDHPSCIQNREWYELAERAVAALNELYQKVGSGHLSQ